MIIVCRNNRNERFVVPSVQHKFTRIIWHNIVVYHGATSVGLSHIAVGCDKNRCRRLAKAFQVTAVGLHHEGVKCMFASLYIPFRGYESWRLQNSLEKFYEMNDARRNSTKLTF